MENLLLLRHPATSLETDFTNSDNLTNHLLSLNSDNKQLEKGNFIFCLYLNKIVTGTITFTSWDIQLN